MRERIYKVGDIIDSVTAVRLGLDYGYSCRITADDRPWEWVITAVPGARPPAAYEKPSVEVIGTLSPSAPDALPEGWSPSSWRTKEFVHDASEAAVRLQGGRWLAWRTSENAEAFGDFSTRDEAMAAALGEEKPIEVVNECRGCGSPLLPENYRVADGCPCNSRRGVNHGLVATATCTCDACDPPRTGSTRYPVLGGQELPDDGRREPNQSDLIRELRATLAERDAEIAEQRECLDARRDREAARKEDTRVRNWTRLRDALFLQATMADGERWPIADERREWFLLRCNELADAAHGPLAKDGGT